ncbi:MAG: DUF433 domain-containing protein [Chloroflexia bacterium]
MASLNLHEDQLPIRMDASGTARIGRSRVTLDVLLASHKRGNRPEEIVGELDTLALADVYSVIGYYLRHQGEVDEYLLEREREASILREKIEQQIGERNGETNRVLARRI